MARPGIFIHSRLTSYFYRNVSAYISLNRFIDFIFIEVVWQVIINIIVSQMERSLCQLLPLPPLLAVCSGPGVTLRGRPMVTVVNDISRMYLKYSEKAMNPDLIDSIKTLVAY